MSMFAVVRYQVEGMHQWKDATKARKYLSYPHRHIFHIEVRLEVMHNDREVEYHDLLDFCKLQEPGGDFEGRSCEDIAKRLGLKLGLAYPGRAYEIHVFEDGEVGAIHASDHFPRIRAIPHTQGDSSNV